VAGDRFEPLAQLPLRLNLLPQAREVKADDLQRRDHLLQSGDVAARIEAVSRLGVQRRPQQADLVVVMERADGQPRPPRQFPHLQGLESHGEPFCWRPREQPRGLLLMDGG
jgi:hypothetical protein